MKTGELFLLQSDVSLLCAPLQFFYQFFKKFLMKPQNLLRYRHITQDQQQSISHLFNSSHQCTVSHLFNSRHQCRVSLVFNMFNNPLKEQFIEIEKQKQKNYYLYFYLKYNKFILFFKFFFYFYFNNNKNKNTFYLEKKYFVLLNYYNLGQIYYILN